MRRRYLSVSLVIIILLTAFPFSAAAFDDAVNRNEMIDLACQVYPEYAHKIRYQEITPANSTRSSDAVLVCSESRRVSDSETLLYSEYSNGIILLTDYDFEKVVTTVDSATGAGATAYTIDITATCSNISGYFQITDFKYTLISSAYDRIDSLGDTYVYEKPYNGIEGDCSFNESSTNPRTQMTETAASDAYANYSLVFRFSARQTDFFTSLLTITVGNNDIIVEHNQT